MTAPTGATGPSLATQEAWTAYVAEVRAAGRTHGVDYMKQGAAKWTPKGRGQYVCLSPFRQERTPSFYVYEGERGWCDFGTGEGGDLFAFVEKQQGCDFRTAVDTIARFCGLPAWDERAKNGAGKAIDLEELRRVWAGEASRRAVFAALTACVQACHALLPDRVRAHLVDRGLAEAFLDAEQIGWCPPGLWEARADWIAEPSGDLLLATGFFHRQRSGKITPSLASRIVFPYWKDGVCQYAIGREHHFGLPPSAVTVADWDKGKYKKLPTHDATTRPYVSPAITNSVLWGQDCLSASRGQTVFVTEGVADACSLKQLGYLVISPVTVRFRAQDHAAAVRLLAGAADVVILNDEDETIDLAGKVRRPGLEGAIAMAETLWAAAIPVRIGRLPKPAGVAKIDVNDLAKAAMAEGGEAKAKEVLDAIARSALPLPDFRIASITKDTGYEEVEAQAEDVGKLVAGAGEGAQTARLESLLEHVPAAGRKLARKAFLRGVKAASSPGGGGAQEPGAAAAGKRTPNPKGGATLIEELGGYERMDAAGTVRRIANFLLVLVRRIARPRGQEWLVCRVLGRQGETLTAEWSIPPKAWVTRKAFKENFPHATMQWLGDDDDVQLLAELLTHTAYGTVPRVHTTDVLGRHGSEGDGARFVLAAGTLDARGRWMAEPDWSYLAEGDSNLAKRLPETRADLADPALPALAKEFVEGILSIHDPEAMAIILAWWVSTLFRPWLLHRLGAHPILNVFASPGTGKTSLFSRAFWPAFAGVTRGELLSCTASLFAFTKDLSSTNALGLVFDEYKPSDMSTDHLERLHRLLRRVYAGETETRGRQDQSTVSYYLTAPVAVVGEAQLDHDQALLERCAFVGLAGNYVKKRPALAARWASFKEKPWHTIAPWLAAWSLRTDPAALLTNATEAIESASALAGVPIDLPIRMRLMLTTIAFGWLGVGLLAQELGATLPKPPSLPALVRRLLTSSLATGDGVDPEAPLAVRTRDHFDEFVRDASILANLGIVKRKKHYTFLDGKVCLWVVGIEAERSIHKRSQGLSNASPGWRSLSRLAREKMDGSPDSYVTHVSRRAWLETQVRCVEIDPKKIPETLHVESFLDVFDEVAGGMTLPGAGPEPRSGGDN